MFLQCLQAGREAGEEAGTLVASATSEYASPLSHALAAGEAGEVPFWCVSRGSLYMAHRATKQTHVRAAHIGNPAVTCDPMTYSSTAVQQRPAVGTTDMRQMNAQVSRRQRTREGNEEQGDSGTEGRPERFVKDATYVHGTLALAIRATMFVPANSVLCVHRTSTVCARYKRHLPLRPERVNGRHATRARHLSAQSESVLVTAKF